MSKRQLYHKVAHEIVDRIDSGVYPSGMRLPSAKALGKTFGVCRNVVREAEISLEAIGRLEVRDGCGVIVRQGGQAGVLERVSTSPLELIQALMLFQSECAALAASMITKAQLVKLRNSLDLMLHLPVGSVAAQEADLDFHLQIARATGNEVNVFFLRNLLDMRSKVDATKTLFQNSCYDNSERRLTEYSTIFGGLAKRDAQASRQAMRAYFERFIEDVLNASEKRAIELARQKSEANRERYLKFTMIG